METEALSPSQGSESSPLIFIFACAICCATFADTYEGHSETVQGLSDGINPKDRLVTKLYLSSCCHVFCGKHIEGGGPAFHPAGQKPKAPCPFCTKDKGDATPRDLYSIRGFHKDEYDPAIPPLWFTTPPMNLDTQSKEMEALRFQYLALIRYCQTSYRTRKPLTDALKKSKQDLVATTSRAEDLQSQDNSLQQEIKKLRALAQQAEEVHTLRAEVQRLQHLEQDVDQFNADVEAFRRLQADIRDLRVFRKNKAAILHYMKLFPKVVKQNTKMKERLSALGFAMPVEPIPNHLPLNSDDLNEIESIAEAYAENDQGIRQTSSSYTVARSAHTSGHPFISSDRPLKRQRIDSPLPHDMHIDAPSSRDAMPPPSKPLSRMRSVRRFIPTLREKFSSNKTTSSERQKNNRDVQMFNNGHWRDAEEPIFIKDQPSSPPRHFRSEPPYMSGALPIEQVSQGSHLLASVGAHGNASEFSFRASSPVKMNGGQSVNYPVQLPTEPSYLRLMDGLTSNNELELSLKDPRENATRLYRTDQAVRSAVSTPQNQRQAHRSDDEQRWGYGHAFLHQSPVAPPKSTNNHRTPPLGKSNGYFSRAQYEPPPAVRHVDSVVSSSFGRSHYDTPMLPEPRITETQTSSHHSGASRSQKYPTSQTSTEWPDQPSLNGLSFINTPLDARNEPIMRDSYRQHEPMRNYHARASISRGMVMRPDSHQSPFVDGGGGSSVHLKPTVLKHQQVQPHSSTHPSFLNRASSSRIGQLPSSMPSIVSSYSPVRNRTQWDTLQRAGVRSSRQMHGNTRSDTSNALSSYPFSRVERRSVKR